MDDDATKLLTSKRGTLEHERLSSLINSMADGVLAIDDKQNIAVYNGACMNILDINTSITNKKISDVVKLYDKNDKLVDLQGLINEIKTQYSSRDLKIKYPDGSSVNVYLSIAPVRLSYGENGTKGFVVLLRDITHEKSIEEAQAEFISVASHELRTPVTIAEGNISNALVLIEMGDNNSKVVDALKQAHSQVVFLSNLINDLSTLSRAERGKLNIEVGPINVSQLLTELAHTYKSQAIAKNLSLTLSLSPELEILNTSQLYLREMLQNFITNAIKYTEQGGVTISAKPYPKGVSFIISDTGIGISRNDQAKIFDRFFRSEDYRTRQSNGTGLGLYVTLKLANLLKAEINLQSELNKGSVFAVNVPNI